MPGITARLRKAKAGRKYRALRKVCAAVDVRDEGRCRACGRWVGEAGHHHHLVYRSQGGLDMLSNLILICGGPNSCHEAVHAKRLLIQGDDANQVLCFLRVR